MENQILKIKEAKDGKINPEIKQLFFLNYQECCAFLRAKYSYIDINFDNKELTFLYYVRKIWSDHGLEIHYAIPDDNYKLQCHSFFNEIEINKDVANLFIFANSLEHLILHIKFIEWTNQDSKILNHNIVDNILTSQLKAIDYLLYSNKHKPNKRNIARDLLLELEVEYIYALNYLYELTKKISKDKYELLKEIKPNIDNNNTVDASILDEEEYLNFRKIILIISGMNLKIDYQKYSNPEFSLNQMLAIFDGLLKQLDVSTYADTNLTYNEMKEKEFNLYKNKGLPESEFNRSLNFWIDKNKARNLVDTSAYADYSLIDEIDDQKRWSGFSVLDYQNAQKGSYKQVDFTNNFSFVDEVDPDKRFNILKENVKKNKTIIDEENEGNLSLINEVDRDKHWSLKLAEKHNPNKGDYLGSEEHRIKQENLSNLTINYTNRVNLLKQRNMKNNFHNNNNDDDNE